MKDSIVVLIDLWQPNWKKEEFPNKKNWDMIDNIITFINSNNNISTVILANYNVKKSETLSDTVWYKTQNKLFGNNIRFIQESEEYFKNGPKVKGFIDSAQDILNYNNKSIFQIAMRNFWELNYYIENIDQNIKNIYLCGGAWEACVKYRPLGCYELYKNLSNKGISIFANPNCIIDFSYNFPNLNLESDWKWIENDTYLYYPNLNKY